MVWSHQVLQRLVERARELNDDATLTPHEKTARAAQLTAAVRGAQKLVLEAVAMTWHRRIPSLNHSPT